MSLAGETAPSGNQLDKIQSILKEDYVALHFLKTFENFVKSGKCCKCEEQEELLCYVNCLHMLCKKCCNVNNIQICTTCNLPGNLQSLCDSSNVAMVFNVGLKIYNNTKFNSNMVTFYSPDIFNMGKKNRHGENILHKTCRLGDKAAVEQLLDSGADPNSPDNAGWSPLHEAVIAGHVEIAELLIRYGAIVNIPAVYRHYVTPLINALINENVPMIKLLIMKGADINCVTEGGLTIFHYCQKNIDLFRTVCLTRRDSVVSEVFSIPKPYVAFLDIEKNLMKKLASPGEIIKREVSDISKENEVHYLVTINNTINKKYLQQAMLRGIMVVTPNWCQDYISYKGMLNPTNYLCDMPEYNLQKSALNMFRKKPKLFDNIYFHFAITTRAVLVKNYKYYLEDLSDLVRIGGGTVLSRPPIETERPYPIFPYHSNKKSDTASITTYVIYNVSPEFLSDNNTDNFKNRTVNWFITCINTFSIISEKF